MAVPGSASALVFSAPVSVGSGNTLNGVACPSTTFCIAVGARGQAVTSANPAGGSGAWDAADIDRTSKLTAVSCAGASVCVATDNKGQVVSRAGGSSAWKAVMIDAGRKLTGISCPAPKLCVAIDNGGGVLVSKNPAGAAGAWKRIAVSKHALVAVSCPSAKLCVAATDGKYVLVSRHPAEGKRAWSALKIANGQYDAIQGLACPGTRLCVATVYSSTVYIRTIVTTNPAAPSSWHRTAILDSESHVGTLFSSVGCGSTHLCVAIDGTDGGGSSVVSVSTQPKARLWQSATFPGIDRYTFDLRLNAVACAGTAECVIVTSDGKVVIGTS
jgi:hypothetical protein